MSMSTPWCTEPFNVVENKVWGAWGLCCRSAPLPYSAKDVSPLEHFNSDLMKEIRRDMLVHNITPNIEKYCHKCIKHEANGVNSMRQGRLAMPRPDKAIQSAVINDGEIKEFEFRSVEIKFFGNLCNLQCKMCGPAYSSSIAATQKKTGEYDGPVHVNAFADLSNDSKVQFYKDLADILPHTDILKFTGGEPMMNKGVVEMVEWIVDNKYHTGLTLKLITNGTQVNEKLLTLGAGFKSFVIAVSIDGVWDVNDYQRTGSDFLAVHNNITEFRHYADGVVSYACVTAINVSSLDELVVYTKLRGLTIDLSSIALYPDYLDLRVLPIEYRNELAVKYHAPQYEHVVKALKDPEWNRDLWNKFIQKNPDIGSIVPGLRKYLT